MVPNHVRYQTALHPVVLLVFIFLKLAGVAGFEPTTFGFGDRRSTAELYPCVGGPSGTRTPDLPVMSRAL
jgi:hypothetical protein